MITTLSSYSLGATRTKSDQIAISSYGQTSKTSKADEGSSNSDSSTLTISTLSTQLAASAKRADERDKSLTRTELADKAEHILNTIIGNGYDAKMRNRTRSDHPIALYLTNDSY